MADLFINSTRNQGGLGSQRQEKLCSPGAVVLLWPALGKALARRLLPLPRCLSRPSPPALQEDSSPVPPGDVSAARGSWGRARGETPESAAAACACCCQQSTAPLGRVRAWKGSSVATKGVENSSSALPKWLLCFG